MAAPKKQMRQRKAKKRVCSFCMDKNQTIDYKDVAKLRKYITERGKILPRRKSPKPPIRLNSPPALKRKPA